MIKIKLHIELAKKKMTKKKLAQLTGITPGVIGKYCNGTIKRINPEQLNKFCKLFKCQLNDVIEYCEDCGDEEK